MSVVRRLSTRMEREDRQQLSQSSRRGTMNGKERRRMKQVDRLVHTSNDSQVHRDRPGPGTRNGSQPDEQEACVRGGTAVGGDEGVCKVMTRRTYVSTWRRVVDWMQNRRLMAAASAVMIAVAVACFWLE